MVHSRGLFSGMYTTGVQLHGVFQDCTDFLHSLTLCTYVYILNEAGVTEVVALHEIRQCHCIELMESFQTIYSLPSLHGL